MTTTPAEPWNTRPANSRLVTAYFNFPHASEEMDFWVVGAPGEKAIKEIAELWAVENLDEGWTSITIGTPSCGTVTSW